MHAAPCIAKSYLIALHDSDVLQPDMLQRVREALIFETSIDSFVFRVVYGIFEGEWRDIYIPVNTERNFHISGYDSGVELNRVLQEFYDIYSKITTLH